MDCIYSRPQREGLCSPAPVITPPPPVPTSCLLSPLLSSLGSGHRPPSSSSSVSACHPNPSGPCARNCPSPGYEHILLEEGEEVMGFGGRPGDKPRILYFLVRCPRRAVLILHPEPLDPLHCLGNAPPIGLCFCLQRLLATLLWRLLLGCEPFVHAWGCPPPTPIPEALDQRLLDVQGPILSLACLTRAKPGADSHCREGRTLPAMPAFSAGSAPAPSPPSPWSTSYISHLWVCFWGA